LGKKIPDTIFFRTLDHVFGELIQFESELGMYDDSENIEYLVFGNLSPDGLKRVRISIDWSDQIEKVFVLEGKDVDMIVDLLSIREKEFPTKFKLWFFQKFPNLKDFEYKFIQTFPFN
jgi:hypothetical protein